MNDPTYMAVLAHGHSKVTTEMPAGQYRVILADAGDPNVGTWTLVLPPSPADGDLVAISTVPAVTGVFNLTTVDGSVMGAENPDCRAGAHDDL